MTRLNPAFTSLKTLNITHQTPLETLLDTPETLPTTEPATPQIGYTVAEAHLPAFSPPVFQRRFVATVIGAGRFVTAGTLSWRMKKNGASVNTSSASVAANTYYTAQAFFYDVAVGDLLELALWSSVSDSNWDYKAYGIMPSRVILINKPRLLCPCIFVTNVNYPTLTLGNPSLRTTYAYWATHEDLYGPVTAHPKTVQVLNPTTYGMFRAYQGDATASNNAVVHTHASYRPYYYANSIPIQIKMRGLKID